jgi:hypothetical protein
MSNNFKLLSLFFISIFSLNTSIYSQDSSQQTTNPNLAQDKFYCVSIPTVVNGQEYDKTLKCETNDAICYVMEGFAMSCVSKIKDQTEASQK